MIVDYLKTPAKSLPPFMEGGKHAILGILNLG